MVSVVSIPAPLPPPTARPLAGATRPAPPARDVLRHDPLVQQLRRIARAASIDVSISDTADDIRAKLHSAQQSPRHLTESLQAAQEHPTPIFKAQAVHLPPAAAASAPTTPRTDERRPRPSMPPVVPEARPTTSPTSGTAFLTSVQVEASSPRANNGVGPPPLGKPPNRSRQFEWPSAYAANHPLVNVQPTIFTTPALKAATQAICLPPERASSARGRSMLVPTKYVQTLGETTMVVPSAASYLADDVSTSKLRGVSPPSNSTVLSRVIASAERLEMELAHATYVASTDALKAVDAARLEALRTHLGALREVINQCPKYVAEMARQRAEQLEREVTARATRTHAAQM